MSALHLGSTRFRSTTGTIQVSVRPSGRALCVSTRARPRSGSLGHTPSPSPFTRLFAPLRSPCRMPGRREWRQENAWDTPETT
eukprot:10779551-Lingulodinium_polyedra.AAC.1